MSGGRAGVSARASSELVQGTSKDLGQGPGSGSGLARGLASGSGLAPGLGSGSGGVPGMALTDVSVGSVDDALATAAAALIGEGARLL